MTWSKSDNLLEDLRLLFKERDQQIENLENEMRELQEALRELEIANTTLRLQLATAREPRE